LTGVAARQSFHRITGLFGGCMAKQPAGGAFVRFAGSSFVRFAGCSFLQPVLPFSASFYFQSYFFIYVLFIMQPCG
jgi:hypothetical protein